MAKKIRFPLELADGTQARTLEDLQEHFDLESVLGYYKNGKLLTWLRDRYLESEAEAVEALDETAVDFQKQFCEIFGAEYTDHSVDLEEIAHRRERLAKLRTYTDEVEFIDHIDLVAFDQEDLADLLDDGQKKIYLCGERFDIPVSQRGVHYKGITTPVIHLTGKLPEGMEETGITFENCSVENMPETAPDTVEEYFHKCLEKTGSREYLNFSVVALSSDQATADEAGNISGYPKQLLEQLKETIQAYISSSSKQIEEFQLRLKNDIGQEFPKQLQSFRLHVSQPVEAAVSKIAIATEKKGYRTIQVQFEHPVFLDGVRYDHVPVLSLNLFEQMKLNEGATVKVHRVGDVIPSIEPIKRGHGLKLDIPTKCPNCGKPLEVRNKKLYCGNPLCPSNIVGRFVGFFEKIGLVGYSDSFAEMLHDEMGCWNLEQVINITADDFEEQGIKTEIAKEFHDKLIEALESRKDYEILAAMGFYGIGPAKAKIILKDTPFVDLAKYFTPGGNKKRLFGSIYVDRNPFLKFNNDHNMKLMNDAIERNDTIYKEFIAIIPHVKHITKDFDNMIRVGHTGGKVPEKVRDLCDKLGYDVVDGKPFDILITADMASNSSKMEYAKKHDIPIYLPEDFYTRYTSIIDRVSEDDEDENDIDD